MQTDYYTYTTIYIHTYIVTYPLYVQYTIRLFYNVLCIQDIRGEALSEHYTYIYLWKAQGASFHCDVQIQYPCTLIPPVFLMFCRRCDENRTPLHSIMAVDEFLDISWVGECWKLYILLNQYLIFYWIVFCFYIKVYIYIYFISICTPNSVNWFDWSNKVRQIIEYNL